MLRDSAVIKEIAAGFQKSKHGHLDKDFMLQVLNFMK